MKILLIGGRGTIGKKLAAALGNHDLIVAGRSGGDEQVDITACASIEKLFQRLPLLDACVTVAMINGAINSFVLGAAQELKQDKRINAVSPGLVEDSMERYGTLFPGYDPVPMSRVVNAYVRSIEGALNGEIIKVY
jgi:dTDP-4-dehydrorhamnose reductase